MGVVKCNEPLGKAGGIKMPTMFSKHGRAFLRLKVFSENGKMVAGRGQTNTADKQATEHSRHTALAIVKLTGFCCSLLRHNDGQCLMLNTL